MSDKPANPLDKIMSVIKSDANSDKSLNLFSLDKDSDVFLKSDVVYPEDTFIASLLVNDSFLVSCGLNPLYSSYIDHLLKVRFSLNRGSRSEFVDINKKDFTTENLAKLGSIKNLTDVRS